MLRGEYVEDCQSFKNHRTHSCMLQFLPKWSAGGAGRNRGRRSTMHSNDGAVKLTLAGARAPVTSVS
jgi:hypothetical protein